VRADALAAIKAELERQRRRAALARAVHEQLDRERRLFDLSVGPVTPLRDRGRVGPSDERPAAEPLQRALDERAALHEAWSDEFDVESLLETDEGLSFKRRHVGADVPKRLRRGQWAIQAQLDLHGFTREHAREQLAAFLHRSVRSGLRCVRVVHGKGLGSPGREPVLKGKVRAWLVQSRFVLAFVQARASDGGHGALLVLLAPAETRHAASSAASYL
jgi:DNA-nicking Smr family endonuclease